MPTFISPFGWTEQGTHHVKDTTNRAADFRRSIQEAGGSVKNIYWTMGRHDGAIIFEALDHATAVMMGGCAKGNVRSETLRAFTEKEIQGVLDKIK